MSPSRALAEVAHRLDELLLCPGNMDRARQLAEDCLDDPERGNIEALQFPNNPDDPFDFTEQSVLRERGLEETSVLTPGQRALALAALHAVGCPGFETVLSIPDDHPRAVRWHEIRDRVRHLGDHAANWFVRVLRRFELDLSSCRAPAEVAAPQSPPTGALPVPRADDKFPITATPVPEVDRTETGEGGTPLTSRADPNRPSNDRQSDIISVIVSAGVPLTRPELVDEMKLKTEGKLGHHLAWMVKEGILVNIQPRGYWPADRPIPD
jgi:hypothetical protein